MLRMISDVALMVSYSQPDDTESEQQDLNITPSINEPPRGKTNNVVSEQV